jgi:RNA-directed DNA polymerase
VARRISDKHVLALIKMWLKTPVEERTGTGGKRLTGGKGSKRGTPQGGVISPLLANIYMNRFLKYWRQNGLGQRLRAHVVVYADDLVILSRRQAGKAHEVLKDVMTRIGLTVNETKTKLREATTERFDFLGYTFGPYWDRRTGKRYLGAGPSSKSRQRLKAKVHALTVPGNVRPWPEARDQLNMMLSGWQAYFGYGTLSRTYSDVNWYVANRVRHFLRRRHKVRSRGSRQFSTERVFVDRKVFRLGRRPQRGDTLHAFA